MFLEGLICNIVNDIKKQIKKSINISIDNLVLTINEDIYYYIEGDTLNMVITLNHHKKCHKKCNILLNNCTKYKLLLNTNNAAVSKNVKKTQLELIYDTKLFKFNNEYFISIDANGLLTYYPDTIEIYDINTITKFINIDNNIATLETLENILEKANYHYLDNANMNNNAYILSLDSILPNKSYNIMNWLNSFKSSVKVPIKYYILDSNIVKLYDNKIKVLRPKIMQFPIHIDDISIDNINNIIFSGKINNYPKKNLNIKYNKFLLNPSIDIIT